MTCDFTVRFENRFWQVTARDEEGGRCRAGLPRRRRTASLG